MEKYEFGDYFEIILISYIVLDIQQCSVMLETALFLAKRCRGKFEENQCSMGQIWIFRQYWILRWSSVLLLFRHLCNYLVSNIFQTYLFY